MTRMAGCSNPVPENGTDPQGQFTLSEAQLHAYFERIGYRCDAAVPPPTLQTLWDLHRCHTTTIPFENLSLVHHKLKTDAYPPIPIDIDSLYHKLVERRRGGYCFEMNTLFAAALRTCGFTLYMGGALVVLPFTTRPEDDPTKIRMNDNHSHLVLNVIMDDGARWLADVGFGKRGPVHPLRVQDAPDPSPSEVMYKSSSSFRLRRGVPFRKENGDTSLADRMPHRVGWYLQNLTEDGWLDVYYIDKGEVLFGDVQFANYWVSTHPRSLWLQRTLVTRPSLTGRQMVVDLKWLTYENGNLVSQKELAGEEERDAVLRDVFGLDVQGGKV